jgi:hypothetical protein
MAVIDDGFLLEYVLTHFYTLVTVVRKRRRAASARKFSAPQSLC